MKTYSKLSLLLVVTLALGACGLFGKKNVSTPAGGGESGAGDASSTSGYAGESTPAPVVIGGEAGSGAGAESGQAGAGNVIYFEFDSTEVTDAGRAVIAATAQYLAANPASRARLEGHADERGTREYNVGLGERRANAVLQALINAGVGASQMSVTSYGEERPAASGNDESAWALNRRVEVIR